MTENKRFTTDTPNSLSEIYDDGRILTNGEVIKYINWYREDMRKFSVENEQLKQELFELKKDYLIETADISDKIYLDDMIEELRREMIVKDGGRLI